MQNYHQTSNLFFQKIYFVNKMTIFYPINGMLLAKAEITYIYIYKNKRKKISDWANAELLALILLQADTVK